MFQLHYWGKGQNAKVYFETEAEMMAAARAKRAEGFFTSVAFISYVPESLAIKAKRGAV